MRRDKVKVESGQHGEQRELGANTEQTHQPNAGSLFLFRKTDAHRVVRSKYLAPKFSEHESLPHRLIYAIKLSAIRFPRFP